MSGILWNFTVSHWVASCEISVYYRVVHSEIYNPTIVIDILWNIKVLQWIQAPCENYGNVLSGITWYMVYNEIALQWRYNGRDSVSNHQPHDYLLNRLVRRRLKKTSKLRVTGPCAGNSPGTGEFPAQMASNAEIVSIWWRHHRYTLSLPECQVKAAHECGLFRNRATRKIGRNALLAI